MLKQFVCWQPLTSNTRLVFIHKRICWLLFMQQGHSLQWLHCGFTLGKRIRNSVILHITVVYVTHIEETAVPQQKWNLCHTINKSPTITNQHKPVDLRIQRPTLLEKFEFEVAVLWLDQTAAEVIMWTCDSADTNCHRQEIPDSPSGR
jgi:hypothetical protein